MTGFYREDSNFSVEFYHGEWIARVRLPADERCSTPEQHRAMNEWLAIGRAAFRAGSHSISGDHL
jgi:hypothetical protein